MQDYGILLRNVLGDYVINENSGGLYLAYSGIITVPHATSVTVGDTTTWNAGIIDVVVKESQFLYITTWVQVEYPDSMNVSVGVSNYSVGGTYIDRIRFFNYHQTADTKIMYNIFKYW
jgi:hypothetical protein